MIHRSPSQVKPGVEYHRVLVGNSRQIARGVLALILALTGLLGFPVAANLLTAPVSSTLGVPISHAMALLAVTLPIPWCMLVHHWLYGVSGDFLHSVQAKFRWAYFGRALLIFLPIWLCFFALLGGDIEGINANWLTFDFISIFAAVVMYTIAEQYTTSGLAFRVGASWAKGPLASLVLGMLVASLSFVVIEQSTEPLVMLYWMLSGAGAAIITWRTGGLETACVLRATYHGLGFASSRVFHRDTTAEMDLEAANAFHPWMFASLVILVIAVIYWLATRKSGPPVTSSAQPGARRMNSPRRDQDDLR